MSRCYVISGFEMGLNAYLTAQCKDFSCARLLKSLDQKDAIEIIRVSEN